jgi:hypothetical protein
MQRSLYTFGGAAACAEDDSVGAFSLAFTGVYN